LSGPGHGNRDEQGIGRGTGPQTERNEDQQLAGFLQGILQGRGQTAKEIAEMALFLCSEKTSAITGQAINVDGGAVFY